MDLKAAESEIKEHVKAEARRALAEERAVLARLLDQLKQLESGEAVAKAKEYLAGIQAKVAALENNVEAEIAKIKGGIQESLKEIEAHKAAVKQANSASNSSSEASTPAPSTDSAPQAAQDNGEDGSAPAAASAPLNDAGVTSPDPAPAASSDSSSGSGQASS